MPVIATCHSCRDEHDLGDRPRVGESTTRTTACPSCSSTSYSSRAVGGEIDKSESKRIKHAVEDVDGIGAETVERLIQQYSLYAELESASVDELTEVKNVGTTVAERIQEAT